MQIAVLPPQFCALVPHSTRPVWHDWGTMGNNGGQQQQRKSSSTSSTARRRLFPEEPAAAEGNKQFVQRLLEELAEQYKQKWGFDFEKERPLDGADGQFQFQAVSAEQVPGFYRMMSEVGPVQQAAETRPSEWGWEEDGRENAAPAQMTKSPARVLRKSRRTVQQQQQTPKRNSTGGGKQSRLTEFLPVRKGLKKTIWADEGPKSAAALDTPTKRRRHSLADDLLASPKRTIRRRAQQQQRKGATNEAMAAAALFK